MNIFQKANDNILKQAEDLKENKDLNTALTNATGVESNAESNAESDAESNAESMDTSVVSEESVPDTSSEAKAKPMPALEVEKPKAILASGTKPTSSRTTESAMAVTSKLKNFLKRDYGSAKVSVSGDNFTITDPETGYSITATVEGEDPSELFWSFEEGLANKKLSSKYENRFVLKRKDNGWNVYDTVRKKYLNTFNRPSVQAAMDAGESDMKALTKKSDSREPPKDSSPKIVSRGEREPLDTYINHVKNALEGGSVKWSKALVNEVKAELAKDGKRLADVYAILGAFDQVDTQRANYEKELKNRAKKLADGSLTWSTEMEDLTRSALKSLFYTPDEIEAKINKLKNTKVSASPASTRVAPGAREATTAAAKKAKNLKKILKGDVDTYNAATDITAEDVVNAAKAAGKTDDEILELAEKLGNSDKMQEALRAKGILTDEIAAYRDYAKNGVADPASYIASHPDALANERIKKELQDNGWLKEDGSVRTLEEKQAFEDDLKKQEEDRRKRDEEAKALAEQTATASNQQKLAEYMNRNYASTIGALVNPNSGLSAVDRGQMIAKMLGKITGNAILANGLSLLGDNSMFAKIGEGLDLRSMVTKGANERADEVSKQLAAEAADIQANTSVVEKYFPGMDKDLQQALSAEAHILVGMSDSEIRSFLTTQKVAGGKKGKDIKTFGPYDIDKFLKYKRFFTNSSTRSRTTQSEILDLDKKRTDYFQSVFDNAAKRTNAITGLQKQITDLLEIKTEISKDLTIEQMAKEMALYGAALGAIGNTSATSGSSISQSSAKNTASTIGHNSSWNAGGGAGVDIGVFSASAEGGYNSGSSDSTSSGASSGAVANATTGATANYNKYYARGTEDARAKYDKWWREEGKAYKDSIIANIDATIEDLRADITALRSIKDVRDATVGNGELLAVILKNGKRLNVDPDDGAIITTNKVAKTDLDMDYGEANADEANADEAKPELDESKAKKDRETRNKEQDEWEKKFYRFLEKHPEFKREFEKDPDVQDGTPISPINGLVVEESCPMEWLGYEGNKLTPDEVFDLLEGKNQLESWREWLNA